MNVVLSIEGRKAIPVRALAYVSNWAEAPDAIARACAKSPTTEIGSLSIPKQDALPTNLLSGSTYRPMSSAEWEPFMVELECLMKRLMADERVEDENWADWRKEAIKKLPDGAFVWLDDFQRWFSNTRPLNPESATEQDGELYFEKESDLLNLDPHIPPEVRTAILDGFERYEVADDTTAISQAMEQAGTLNKVAEVASEKPWLIPAECDPIPELPWYTPARYFARELVKEDSTLLIKRDLLAQKVVGSLSNAGIKKRGGKKPFDPSTVKKAFSNVKLG